MIITLVSEIRRVGRWCSWVWIIYENGWPVDVDHTDCDPLWFAMCAIGDHA